MRIPTRRSERWTIKFGVAALYGVPTKRRKAFGFSGVYNPEELDRPRQQVSVGATAGNFRSSHWHALALARTKRRGRARRRMGCKGKGKKVFFTLRCRRRCLYGREACRRAG